VGEVRDAVAQRRRHRDHADVEAGGVGVVVAGPVAPGRQGGGQPVGRYVLHERLAGAELLDPGDVEVDAHHVVPGLDGTHRERQADVPLPDQHHLLDHRSPPLISLLGYNERSGHCGAPRRWQVILHPIRTRTRTGG
jgi:hypothetical protein